MSSEITSLSIIVTPADLASSPAVGASHPSSKDNVLVSTPSRSNIVGHRLWGKDLPDEDARTHRARKYSVNHHESWFRPESDGSVVKLSVSCNNAKAGDGMQEPESGSPAGLDVSLVPSIEGNASSNNESTPAPKADDIVTDSAPAGLELGLTPSDIGSPKSDFDTLFGKICASIERAKHPKREESPFREVDFKALEIFLKFEIHNVRKRHALLEKTTGVEIKNFGVKRGTQFEHEGTIYTLPRSVEFVYNFEKSKMTPFLTLNVKAGDEFTENPIDFLQGEGGMKKAKLAVDLETGELCVRTTALAENFGFQEIFLLNTFSKEMGAVPYYGVFEFTSKTGVEKIAVYAPLCQVLDEVDLSGLSLQARLKLIIPAFVLLERIHQGGNIHCDIKPGNIFILNGISRIADFGIAKPSHTTHEGFVGSLPFSPPENLARVKTYLGSGKPTKLNVKQYTMDFSVDLWGMGIILHNILFNKPPAFTDPNNIPDLLEFFKQITGSKFTSIIEKPANENSIFFLLWNLLQLDPKKRFSAKEAVEKLVQLLDFYEEMGWDTANEVFQKEREIVIWHDYTKIA